MPHCVVSLANPMGVRPEETLGGGAISFRSTAARGLRIAPYFPSFSELIRSTFGAPYVVHLRKVRFRPRFYGHVDIFEVAPDRYAVKLPL